jgi:hypothetical protein
MAIAAGLKELDELEQSEDLFNESDFDASSESDNENNSKLSKSLEDINYELKKRADLTTYEKEIFFLELKSNFYIFRNNNNVETSLRLRQERLKRNEVLEKKVNEMKAKLHEQSSTNKNNNTSILKLLMTKYRRPFYIGIFTIFTGSIFFYKFITSYDRTH